MAPTSQKLPNQRMAVDDEPHVDILIIGGGLAGLSLCAELIARGSDHSIAVLESRPAYDHDRTWSFWAGPDHSLQHLVKSRWAAFEYGQLGRPSKVHFFPNKPYQTIESHRFYQNIIDKIDRAPNVQLRLGQTIEHCQKHQRGWQVATSSGRMLARAIIDTRPPSPDAFSQSTLYQCFVGETITVANGFTADRVELMTDMTSDEHGFLFTYCLPTSHDQALIEATRFAATPLDWCVLEEDIARLKARRGWHRAPIEHTERARLPMGLPPTRSSDPSYVYAGTRAGGLRAATGYGFWRIQKWAGDCADALISEGKPAHHPKEPWLQAWMDDLFLRVLKRFPEQAPALFFQMLDRLPPEVFIRFMSDESNLFEKLRVVLAMPKRPFLATIGRR